MPVFGERFATALDVMQVRAAAFAAKWARLAATRCDSSTASRRADANARFAQHVAEALARLDPGAYTSVGDLRLAARAILDRTATTDRGDRLEARAELAAVIEAI
jgi:hypothetical protein